MVAQQTVGLEDRRDTFGEALAHKTLHAQPGGGFPDLQGRVRHGLPGADDGCPDDASPGVTSLTAVRAPQRGAQPAADMVLTNGTILTVDANDATAQAIAIAGGRIVAVGTNDAVTPRIGANTVVIDLHGRTAK